MALTKNKKKEVVDELTGLLKDSKTIVFVNFKGLTVGSTNTFRKNLREAGVGYKVSKKTLLARVLDTKGIKGDVPTLDGEIGIAYASDLLSPAREVFAFQKKFKDNVVIVGGVFEGKFMSKEEMVAIASIPSMQTLLGMFVNVVNSPVQGFVMALDQIAKKKTA